jgi:hypothetical protein
MRETVEAFEQRTGRIYHPMVRPGRAFSPGEACPTLYRYPGPCGLREGLDEGISWLGPAESPSVLLADVPMHADAKGAAWFGTLAVLQPLCLDPVITEPRATLLPDPPLVVRVPNFVVPAAAAVVWIPPSAFDLVLDDRTDPEAVRAAIPGYQSSRRRIHEDLLAYLDELAAMAASGAPGPGRSWCTVPEIERQQWLDTYGVSSRWTRARKAA